jgi:hypothetical protein
MKIRVFSPFSDPFSVDYIHLQVNTQVMPATAKRLHVEQPMNVEARLARLEERSENIQRGIADLKVDIRDVRKELSELARTVSELGKIVASSEGKMIKWMVGTLFAATGAAFTFAKYVS